MLYTKRNNNKIFIFVGASFCYPYIIGQKPSKDIGREREIQLFKSKLQNIPNTICARFTSPRPNEETETGN